MKFTKPLLSLDVESTGLNPTRDRIISLGLICLYPEALSSLYRKNQPQFTA
jgi:DNA polymerase III epsilon subunit-like protein